MSNRKLQERLLDSAGRPLTEWDDAQVPEGWHLPGWGECTKSWTRLVADLNAAAKVRGDNTRWRSVEVDD